MVSWRLVLRFTGACHFNRKPLFRHRRCPGHTTVPNDRPETLVCRDGGLGIGDPARRRIRGGGLLADPSLQPLTCLLYTSDAADERSSVDLGGRRIIKKK